MPGEPGGDVGRGIRGPVVDDLDLAAARRAGAEDTLQGRGEEPLGVPGRDHHRPSGPVGAHDRWYGGERHPGFLVDAVRSRDG